MLKLLLGFVGASVTLPHSRGEAASLLFAPFLVLELSRVIWLPCLPAMLSLLELAHELKLPVGFLGGLWYLACSRVELIVGLCRYLWS